MHEATKREHVVTFAMTIPQISHRSNVGRCCDCFHLNLLSAFRGCILLPPSGLVLKCNLFESDTEASFLTTVSMQNLSTQLAPPRLLTYHDPDRLTGTDIKQQYCAAHGGPGARYGLHGASWPRGMLIPANSHVASPLQFPPHCCAAFWLRRARSNASTSVSFSARAELSSILTNSSRDGEVPVPGPASAPAAASPPAPLLAGCGGGVCMSWASCWRIASISSSTLFTRAASSCTLARAASSSALSALPILTQLSCNPGGGRGGGAAVGGGGGGAGSSRTRFLWLSCTPHHRAVSSYLFNGCKMSTAFLPQQAAA